MKYFLIFLLVATVFLCSPVVSFAQDSPTPTPQPQIRYTNEFTTQNQPLSVVTLLKNSINGFDSFLGGFIFYTPDPLASTIVLKDKTEILGITKYRDMFLQIAIPILAIIIAIIAISKLGSDNVTELKSFALRFFCTLQETPDIYPGMNGAEHHRCYALNMRIRSLSHCHYQHEYHIVWGTKYRRKFLKQYVKEAFLEALFEILKKYPKLHLVAVNTDQDHVHLQIEIAPDISVSKVMKRIKGYSSIYLKRRFKFLRRIYLDEGVWSVGYFSSTIGLNEEVVRRYISYQGKRDRPQTLKLGFS